MSKREPLLLNKMVPENPPFAEAEAQEAFYTGIDWARDHYERLIDEGKLRVVEDVELWHPTVPEEEWKTWLTGSDAEFTMLATRCCGRNPWTPPWGMGKAYMEGGEVKRVRHEYVCPGCGNKIKR